jgi:hypothetical protein
MMERMKSMMIIITTSVNITMHSQYNGNIIIKTNNNTFYFCYFLLFILFLCAYNLWVISPPFPHLLPYTPYRPFPLPPTFSLPGRNYFALISNFVEKRL